MEFRCNQCGLCCQVVGRTVDRARAVRDEAIEEGTIEDLIPVVTDVASFPYLYNEHGRCEKLGEDNKCTVYFNRPGMCDVEETRSKFYKAMSKKDFYMVNEGYCQSLQEEAVLTAREEEKGRIVIVKR